MFKTDKESLERLSFEFDERDIATISHLLNCLKRDDLSTISDEEIARVQKGLEQIGALKLDKKYYAFHVEDSYAYNQGPQAGYGVEVFLRQGDKLVTFIQCGSRDYVYKANEVVKMLKRDEIKTVYTGRISRDSGFLDLPYNTDDEDRLTRDILEESEIEELTEEGINVIVLDRLI